VYDHRHTRVIQVVVILVGEFRKSLSHRIVTRTVHGDKSREHRTEVSITLLRRTSQSLLDCLVQQVIPLHTEIEWLAELPEDCIALHDAMNLFNHVQVARMGLPIHLRLRAFQSTKDAIERSVIHESAILHLHGGKPVGDGVATRIDVIDVAQLMRKDTSAFIVSVKPDDQRGTGMSGAICIQVTFQSTTAGLDVESNIIVAHPSIEVRVNEDDLRIARRGDEKFVEVVTLTSVEVHISMNQKTAKWLIFHENSCVFVKLRANLYQLFKTIEPNNLAKYLAFVKYLANVSLE
jgi:hypothetical protein